MPITPLAYRPTTFTTGMLAYRRPACVLPCGLQRKPRIAIVKHTGKTIDGWIRVCVVLVWLHRFNFLYNLLNYILAKLNEMSAGYLCSLS